MSVQDRTERATKSLRRRVSRHMTDKATKRLAMRKQKKERDIARARARSLPENTHIQEADEAKYDDAVDWAAEQNACFRGDYNPYSALDIYK